MRYFHVCMHCHFLSFFSESAKVYGIGNVCVLTLFVNSRGSLIVWVSLFFIIIFWYWLPFSRVHLRMVCALLEKMSLTGISDLTSLSFRWGVTSSQLSIKVFLLEKLSFKSSLRDSVSSKSCEKQNQTFLGENAELWFCEISIFTPI